MATVKSEVSFHGG